MSGKMGLAHQKVGTSLTRGATPGGWCGDIGPPRKSLHVMCQVSQRDSVPR